MLGATEIVNMEKGIVRKICLFTQKISRFLFAEYWYTSHYQAYLPVDQHWDLRYRCVNHCWGGGEDLFTVKHCVSVNNIQMS